jgi:ABC-type transporter Mla MlaB component
VDGELRLKLVGTADMRIREKLQELLSQLDEEARRVGANVVFVDCRELEFMDSSCFKGVVSWVDQAKQRMGANSYRIRFASRARALHRRSLYALQCFAGDLVTLEVL